MQYRKLSTTELLVSEICLGTMNWGQQNTEEDAHAQLDMAVEMGVNFIDTAEAYPIPPEREKQGRTERYLGSWLSKSGKRDKLVIASKVSQGDRAPMIQTRDASAGLTKESIMEAVDGTLERLGTDYLDLYQVHYPERSVNIFGKRAYEHNQNEAPVPIEETLGGLADVLRAGKARFIGVSNETPWGVAQYLKLAEERGLPRIVTIQNQYSLLNRTFEIGLSEFAHRESVRLLAYSPLSMGVLSGKYLSGAEPPGSRFALFKRNQDRYNAPHAQDAVKRYVAIAEKYGLNPAQMALAFVKDRPFVDAVIIGATTLEQLKTDIGSSDVALFEDVLSDITEVYRTAPDPHA
jgi:aryl-alcohol dehydrogenase-like predicted oxidoreductase